MSEQDFLKKDFSGEGNKELIKQRAVQNSTHNNEVKETTYMKMNVRRLTAAAAAVIVLAGTGFSMTTYGQSLISIIKEAVIGSGHAIYYQQEANVEAGYAIPEHLKGKLYDAEGNEMTEFPRDGRFYSADGEEIFLSGNEPDSLEIVSSDQAQGYMMGEYTYVTTWEETVPYLAFTPLTPSYVPDGYAIESFMLFQDESGVPVRDSKYLQFYITNGDKKQDIYVQLRLMDEETAFAAGMEEFEEIEVKGCPGVSSAGGKNIDFETDGVMVMISARRSSLPAAEIMKMAESFIK